MNNNLKQKPLVKAQQTPGQIFKQGIAKINQIILSKNPYYFEETATQIRNITKIKDKLTKTQKEIFKKLLSKLFIITAQRETLALQKQIKANKINSETLSHIVRLNAVYSKLPEKYKKNIDTIKIQLEVQLKKNLKKLAETIKKSTFTQLVEKRDDVFLMGMRSTLLIAKMLCKNYKKTPIQFLNEVKGDFEKILISILDKCKKEFNRIKSNRDYMALSKLLFTLKAGNYFLNKNISSRVMKRYSTLRSQTRTYVRNLPLSVVKKQLRKIKEKITPSKNVIPDSLAAKFRKTKGITENKATKKFYMKIAGKDYEIRSPYITNKKASIWSVKDLGIYLKGREHQIYALISLQDFLKGNTLNIPVINKKIAKAFDNYRLQEKNKGALQRFDLPKNRKIGYISLVKKNPDKAVDRDQEFSIHMAKVLKAAGYKIDLSAMKGKHFAETNNPKTFLKKQLNILYSKGVRDFYLALNGHGLPSGVDIGKMFSGKDLVEIISDPKFRQCKFTVTSSACHGGGFRKAVLAYVKKNPAQAKNIGIFLQTKPSTSNLSAELGSDKNTYSTYYYVLFANYLLSGMTFGQAAYKADVESQRMALTNAESIVGGKLIAQQTPSKSSTNAPSTANA
ncbi:hypothetical protein ACFL3T_00590 [Patescibacteria group bacterium]